MRRGSVWLSKPQQNKLPRLAESDGHMLPSLRRRHLYRCLREQARPQRGRGRDAESGDRAGVAGQPDRSRACDGQGLLFILDGAKALSRAVRNTFCDAAEIQRCQLHKGRNVVERLPKGHHAAAKIALRQARTMSDHTKAQRLLEN